MMTIQEATQQLLFQLFNIYEEREARNIADLVMERVTEWKRIDRIINKQVPLSQPQARLLVAYTSELLEHRPLQYVLKEAWFYGLRFYVDEHVLIPRPETEELVGWIIDESGARGAMKKLRILDIGTGSGCIAVALKKHLPDVKVYACDVSKDALVVAGKNAEINQTQIELIHCDVLIETERNRLPVVDIIVSNPPYVPLSDSVSMQSNVVDYEPHGALFVSDSDPRVFYNAIAGMAPTHLSPNGSVYVEIHENMGAAISALLKDKLLEPVLRKDLQGKERMIKASRV